MATTLTSKGQVTVPKKIRDYLGLRPGAAVGFVLGPDGEVIVQPVKDSSASRKASRFAKLRGTMTTGKSTDELMRVLRDTEADNRDPGLK